MSLFKSDHSFRAASGPDTQSRQQAWAADHGLGELGSDYQTMLQPVIEIEADILQKKIEGARPEAITNDYLNIIREQNWIIIRLLSELVAKG